MPGTSSVFASLWFLFGSIVSSSGLASSKISVVIAFHQRSLSIQQMEATTENPSRTQYRDKQNPQSPAPMAASTPQSLHGELREYLGRGSGNILRARKSAVKQSVLEWLHKQCWNNGNNSGHVYVQGENF